MLRSLASTSQYSQVTALIGHLIHYVQGRLLQRGSCRSTAVWTGPGAVCHQHDRSAHGRCPQIQPYDTTSDGLTLAVGSITYPVQVVCAGVRLPWTEQRRGTCRTWQCLSAAPHVVSYAQRRPLIWWYGTTNTSASIGDRIVNCECAQFHNLNELIVHCLISGRAVRRRTGGRRRRWVVLWPAAAARRAFFIGGGGVALWSAAAASDRTREHWNSALAGQAFFLVL